METKCFVSALRRVVVQPGVRRELGTPVLSAPVLGCKEEGAPNASIAMTGHDEPTFQVPYGPTRVATVRVRA